jgi:hypothetical protein
VSDPQARLQRAIAEEFERRGWEYDLSTGQLIAHEIIGNMAPTSREIADRVSGRFLKRSGASRADLVDAIDSVLRSKTAERPTREALRVLFVASGPTNEDRLRLGAEHRDIVERLRKSTLRAEIDIEATLAARPTDLLDAINRLRPTALHISGHGDLDGILLENDIGMAVEVDAGQLVGLVRTCPSLRLLVLNSCESSVLAEAISKELDGAIGMSASIEDDAAREFAAQLYSSLGEGLDLKTAFEQAKVQVQLAGLPGFDIPQLLLREPKAAPIFLT